MQSAKELFVHELTDMLDAEQKLVEALGELAEDHSEEPQLQKGFKSHQAQTEKQLQVAATARNWNTVLKLGVLVRG